MFVWVVGVGRWYRWCWEALVLYTGAVASGEDAADSNRGADLGHYLRPDDGAFILL